MKNFVVFAIILVGLLQGVWQLGGGDDVFVSPISPNPTPTAVFRPTPTNEPTPMSTPMPECDCFSHFCWGAPEPMRFIPFCQATATAIALEANDEMEPTPSRLLVSEPTPSTIGVAATSVFESPEQQSSNTSSRNDGAIVRVVNWIRDVLLVFRGR